MVRAAVDLCAGIRRTLIVGLCLVIVAVERAEITHVQTCLLIDVPGTAQT